MPKFAESMEAFFYLAKQNEYAEGQYPAFFFFFDASWEGYFLRRFGHTPDEIY